MGPLDYAATVALGAGALAEKLAPKPLDGRWGYGWSLDEDARDELVLGDEGARDGAARASDVSLGLLSAQPYLDGLLVATVHDDVDTAWQVTTVSAFAMLFNVTATGLVKRLSRRERPIAIECREDPAHDESCLEERPPRAFFSGHTSSAFTAASLTCLHHSHLPIYGEGWDELACISALSVATMVAHERVVADRHHVTDVIVGAAMGGFSGAVLPLLLYAAIPTPNTDWLVLPRVTDEEVGVSTVARW